MMIINWLINFFKRVEGSRTNYSDGSTSIYYKETGILGFRLIKKHWNKRYTSYGVKLLSHLEDDDSLVCLNNILYIYFKHTIYTIKTPFKLIKPVVDYIHFFPRMRPDGIIAMVRSIVYTEKEYAIHTYHEDDKLNSIFFYWAYIDSLMGRNDISQGVLKIYNVFWNHEEYVCSELLDPNTLEYVMDITNMGSDEVYKYLKTHKKYSVILSFKDYDGTDITATAFINKQKYVYGTSKFTRLLMKLFKKPTSYNRYNISFSGEVGRGKEEWKGGTLSCSGLLVGSIADAISKNYNIPINLITIMEQ